MNCKFINPHTNNELELSKQLMKYYKLDEYEELDDNMSNFLDSQVSYFFSDSFKEAFGDWTQSQYPEDHRIDFNGGPKLFTDDNGKMYVIDKDNNKMFINNTRFEGLNAFDMFKGQITNIKNDAKVMITKYIFDKHKNTEDDITDFNNLKFNIKNEIIAFLDDQISKRPDNEDAYELFKEFVDDFELEVKDFLNSVNLSYNENEDGDDSVTQEQLEDNGAIVGKSSIEKNSKDNATGNIKLMLSLIPDNTNTSIFFVGDSMIPFDRVWNEVQSELAGIPKLLTTDGQPVNILDVMKDKLNIMSSTKPYIKHLIESLNSSSPNLQAQFYQAFGNLGKMIQDTMEVDLADQKYKSTNSTESSSKKTKILEQAGLEFKNNFTIFNEETNTYSFNLPEYAQFRQKYFNLYEEGGPYKNLVDINLAINKAKRAGNTPSEQLLNQQKQLVKESQQLFYQIITDLGFSLDENSFNYYLTDNGSNYEVTPETTIKRLGEFYVAFDSFNKGLVPKPTDTVEQQNSTALGILFKKDKYLNPLKGEGNSIMGQKTIVQIAEAIAHFDTEMSENMVMSGNKSIWAYSLTTHLFDVINILNSSPTEVEKRLELPYNRHSVYLNELLKGKQIKLHRTNSMMEKDKAEGSVDNTNTSKNDAIVRDVFESLLGKKVNGKSLFATAVPADKGTALKTQTDFFLNTNVRREGNEIIVNDETLSIFRGYVNDDLSSAIAAKKHIDDNTDPVTGKVNTSNLVQYFHTDGKGNVFDILDHDGNSIFTKDFAEKIDRTVLKEVDDYISNNPNEGYRKIYVGAAFKNYMIPEFSPEVLMKDAKTFSLFYNEDFTPLDIDVVKNKNNDTLTAKQVEFLNTFLTKTLSRVIQSHEDQLIKAGIFKEQGTRDKFDAELYSLYYDADLGPLGTMAQITADYTINSLIAQIEYSKLFNGPINNHKNIVDYFKRSAKGYIDGKSLLLGLEHNDHIAHVAVLQDIETSSPYIDEMGLSEEEKKFSKKHYGSDTINQADAQAYITPERWKFLLQRLGQWDNISKAIWSKIELMESGKNVEFTKEELKHLSTKPLKGVYYNNEANTPRYLKYSQTVLLKSMVKGSPLEKLLNQMRKQNIDEAIMQSGVKAGAQFGLENVSEAILNNKPFTLKSITIDNRFWKLQQDLPNKGIKDTLLGSQLQKNIFDNFVFDTDYSFNEKTYTGAEVYNNIHSIIGEKSNRAIENFRKKFSIGEDYVISDWGSFAKDVADQLRKEKIDENVVQAVEKELTPMVIPQARDKILSTIMSKINKAAVKLKTNGTSLIQMSNFGLDQNLADKTGVLWIKDKQQLAEPRKIIDPVTGKPKVLPGQVFISGNLLSNYIPNWRDYSLDELFGKDRQGGMFPKEMLQLLGYRIPNQAMSSNDALEIVGILPDTYIDTIVAYTGITTKTGSDFDVDKMFIFLPSMKKSDTGVEYENYNNDLPITEQSEGALNNRLFEMYYSILTHPNNYKNLITPIDHPHIKSFINKELFPGSEEITAFKAFSPLYQIDMKYGFIAGGFGIGQVANQLVNSIMNQNVQMSLEEYIGWGNYKGEGKNKQTVFDMKSDKGFYDEDGKYPISASLTAILNAFVDIAKDDYITKGNWNTQTTNTGLFLIRAGVHPHKVLAFLAQPSLIEMIRRISEKEGITSKVKDSSTVVPTLKQEYLDKLKESLGFNNEQFSQLLSEISSKTQISLIEGVLSNNKITTRSINELKSNVNQSKETPQYYLDQYLALVEYERLKPTVKEFTKAVGAAKYGENGIGKRLVEFLTQRNKTNDVINKSFPGENGIQGFTNMLYNETQIDNGYTSLGSHQKNSETFFTNLVNANPKVFLTATEFFSSIMNDMTAEIHNNKKYLDDTELGKVFEQSFYTMIISQSKVFAIDRNSNEFDFLFKKAPGEQMHLTDQMLGMREQYRRVKRPNFLLENIEIKEDGVFSFLGIDSRKGATNGFKEKAADAWRDLEKDNPDLSDNLVKYAYNQSGFRYNANQMYQFIPHEIFVRNRMNKYIDNVNNRILDGKINPEVLEDQIYRHNWNNSKIVPVIKTEDIEKLYALQSGFRLKDSSNRHSGQSKELDIKTYPKFVSYGELLYKLDSYITTKKNGVDVTEPIYFITHKLGYKSKKGQFHEYSMYDNRKSSSYVGNNITDVNVLNAIQGVKNSESWSKTISYDLVPREPGFRNSIREFGKKEVIEEVTPVVEETIKEGVSNVFENHLELSKIGSQSQYSQYLDTIFPDSKVKDIVYHATIKDFENFDKSFIRKSNINAGVSGSGFYFTPNKDFASKTARLIYGTSDVKFKTSLININKPYVHSESQKNELGYTDFQYIGDITNNGSLKETLAFTNNIIEKGYDSVIETYENKDSTIEKEMVVFEPEQIHILGNKEDIEGFKKFIEETTTESQQTDLFDESKSINIYSSEKNGYENLSNFAIRPFTVNVETPSGSKEFTFQSVEQGFHFYKAIVAENPTIGKKILETTNGGTLRNLTNRQNLPMTSEQVKEWDETSKSIMLNLMYDSYAQNPKEAIKLLATGNATITHTQDNTRWKTDFPEVVMTVRDMLREEGFDKNNDWQNEDNSDTCVPF